MTFLKNTFRYAFKTFFRKPHLFFNRKLKFLEILRNLTFSVAFYSKFATFSNFKKFKVFFQETYFLKNTPFLNVSRNPTIPVAFYGRFATI